VNDSLSLSGFYAFGRPIYLNRQTRRGYAFGYSRSILSHCGVLVDSTEPAFTDHVVSRHGFYPPAKLLVIESPKLYPEVEASRSLVLTDRYLLDVFRVAGTDGREHDAIWVVHALGQTEPSDPGAWAPVSLDGPLEDFQEGLAPTKPGGAREVTVVQRLALDDPGEASLPPAWYEREIGVRVSLLGDEGLELFVAKTPIDDPENKKLEDPRQLLQLREVGGTSVIARQKAATTRFTALHVPFEGGTAPPLRAIELTTGDDAVVAVEVTDPAEGGPRDWIFLDLRPEEARRDAFAVDIPGAGRVELVDHAFVRSGTGEIQVWGDLRSLRLEGAPANSRLTHNGRLSRTSTDGDALVYPAE
jgi:hypothetical protein